MQNKKMEELITDVYKVECFTCQWFSVAISSALSQHTLHIYTLWSLGTSCLFFFNLLNCLYLAPSTPKGILNMYLICPIHTLLCITSLMFSFLWYCPYTFIFSFSFTFISVVCRLWGSILILCVLLIKVNLFN